MKNETVVPIGETIGVKTGSRYGGLAPNYIQPSRRKGKGLGFSFGLLLLGASAASAQTAPAVLDHLLCYLTPQQPLVSQLAYLQDQFEKRINVNGVETIYDIRMELFCTPVKKTVIGSVFIPPVPVVHPEAHMAMYRTTVQPTTLMRSVQVNNQFGTQNLITGEAEFLGVPSGKTPLSVTGVPASLPAIPPALDLDHFRCYYASGPAINKVVQLNDQFFVANAEVATVLTPRLFCNPVAKTVLAPSCPTGQFCPVQTTPINHPASHSVCYEISPRTQLHQVVVYNNQFVQPGTVPTVALNNPALLCVPSTKNENWTVIPANPLTP